MIYETKACPICGHKVALIGKDREGRFLVECAGCGLRTEAQDDVISALDRWNDRRYGLWMKCRKCSHHKPVTWNPDGKFTLKCSRCQNAYNKKLAQRWEYCPHCGGKITKETYAETEESISRE